jgi:hypothetical protein
MVVNVYTALFHQRDPAPLRNQRSLVSKIVFETGTRKVRNEHTTYCIGIVLFPQGAVHIDINPKYKPMVVVAEVNLEDPRNNTLAASLLQLRADRISGRVGVPGRCAH